MASKCSHRSSPRRTFGTLVSGSALATLTWLVLSPLLPQIIADLDLSPVWAGFALSSMSVLMAATRFVAGQLADRLSYKTVLVSGISFLLLGTTVILTAVTRPMFYVSISVIGVGVGLYAPAAAAQIANMFTARRGQMFGIHEASIHLGGIAAAGLATAALHVGAWRSAFVPIIPMLVIILGLTHYWNESGYDLRWVELEGRTTVARLLIGRRTRLGFVALAMFSFAWTATATFFPTFLQVEKGFPPAFATNAFAVLFVVGIITTPVAGNLGDRVGHLEVAGGAASLSAGALLLMVISQSLPLLITAIVAFAVGLSAFFPVMVAFLMDAFQDAKMGTDFGTAASGFLLVGGAGPLYVGFVAERMNYTAAYIGLVPVLCASGVAAFWLLFRR